MPLLPILRFPDPRLKKLAAPVRNIDENIRRLARDMAETMYEAPGIGLAATQVDVHKRVIVIDTSEQRDRPLVLINPEIVWRSAETILGEEGCLSVPAIYDKVVRHTEVTVRAQDRDGAWFEQRVEGLTAVCVQHEMDHLIGKVFVEYLSPLKRERIRTKLAKRAREDPVDQRRSA